MALLLNIFERRQEARNPFFRVVELTDETEDPAVWGMNFPLQYDAYQRTVDQVRTHYGGSEAMPRTPTDADPRSVVAQSKLDEDPRLRTMWAGYSATSTDRCNTSVESFCWSFKLQRLTRPFIELTCHLVQVRLRVHR